MRRRRPRSTRFPYTTLFRSMHARLTAAGMAALLAWASAGPAPAAPKKPRAGDDVFGLTKVWEMHLTVQTKDWDGMQPSRDRKSTRLNSSHANISYAVFCLKK